MQRAPGNLRAPSLPGRAEDARGIEKRDIRAMLVYPDGVYSPLELQQMQAAVQGLVDQIASGAKLTKADASRLADPSLRLLESIEESFRGRSRTAMLAMAATPSSAGNRPVACPPPGCGCDQNGRGGVDCNCTLLNNQKMGPFCMCLLCYEKHVLSELPSDLRQAAPGRPVAQGYLVIVATPPDAPAQLRQSLADQALKTLQTEPWPAGLVIKDKSYETRINGGASSLK